MFPSDLFDVGPVRIGLHGFDAFQAAGLGLVALADEYDLGVFGLQAEAELPGLVLEDLELGDGLCLEALHGLILDGGLPSRQAL